MTKLKSGQTFQTITNHLGNEHSITKHSRHTNHIYKHTQHMYVDLVYISTIFVGHAGRGWKDWRGGLDRWSRQEGNFGYFSVRRHRWHVEPGTCLYYFCISFVLVLHLFVFQWCVLISRGLLGRQMFSVCMFAFFSHLLALLLSIDSKYEINTFGTQMHFFTLAFNRWN